MGKAQSTLPREAMQKARQYFEVHEINDVMEIFQNLRDDERLEGKCDGLTHAGIDMDTFGEYFSYPGVLREQIFKVFDTNGDGLIDREEFMRGLAMCCRGGLDEKLQFCFSMFDLSGDGFIDKTELHKCLTSTAFASFALLQAVAVEQGFMKEEDSIKLSEFSQEVDIMVEDAFNASDHNGDNKLSFEEFKVWMINTPEVCFFYFFCFRPCFFTFFGIFHHSRVFHALFSIFFFVFPSNSQIVGILYSVFDMRGHVDTENVIKQFDDSKKEMDFDDDKEKRIATLLAQKKLSDGIAAKLMCENSQLQIQVRQLKAENEALRNGEKAKIVSPRQQLKSMVSPRK